MLLILLPFILGALALPWIAVAADPPVGSLSIGGSSMSWVGTATAFGSANETTCQEGVNCDTFTLTVDGTQTEWRDANKIIKVNVTWQIPANDYDVYIHKDSNEGVLVANSGNGAPNTQESAIINPGATGTGVYTVRVLYFAGTPSTDQYHATASVMNAPAAVYLKGGFKFSQPRTVSAPATTFDGEPSSRCDKFGNYYVAGIRGVPAGVDLWYFDLKPDSPKYDPYLRNPIYRGQPDAFVGEEAGSVGADGGGDVDIAVGFPATGSPTIAFTSLVAANISSSRSTDLGVTWQKNPAGNVTGGIPVDDRQWLEFYKENTVYLLYRTIAPAVTQIQRSTDGGLTWGPARTAGAIGQVGSCDVDQNDGTVYVSGSDGKVAVGIPDPVLQEPVTFNVYQAVPGGSANIFVVVKVADDGTAYVCYSDGKDINLTYSTDKGQNWSIPVRVSDGPETKTSLLPWIETGPKPGSVGIVWFGTSTNVNDDTADWHVFFAQCMNANTSTPTFTQTRVTPHPVHSANISLGGTLGDANRNLLDYFQISFDTKGQALIAYTDDHNDYDGNVFVTHQIGGRTVLGDKPLGGPVEGSGLPAEAIGIARSQVTDPEKDVVQGAVGVLPATDPLDILAIGYSATGQGSGIVITAKMSVSEMASIPASSNWRMSFALNPPFPDTSRLAQTRPFSYNPSDRSDQFYVQATTDAQGVPTYTWGTAVRNGDGSITYTSRGTADAGSIDPATRSITVSVAANQLNQYCRAPIKNGGVICGLRGHTFLTGPVNAKYDRTRGGREYVIP